mgnify:CR=1 FL=1
MSLIILFILVKINEAQRIITINDGRFENDGRCTAIPGYGGAPGAAHRASPHAVREQQGYVWVWGEAEDVPETEPFRFRLADAPGNRVLRYADVELDLPSLDVIRVLAGL